MTSTGQQNIKAKGTDLIWSQICSSLLQADTKCMDLQHQAILTAWSQCRGLGLRARSHRLLPPRLHMPVQLVTCASDEPAPNGRFPRPPLRFSPLLVHLRALGKTRVFTGLLYNKEWDKGYSQMKRYMGELQESQAQALLFLWSWATTSSQHMKVLTTPEILQAPYFGDFYGSCIM